MAKIFIREFLDQVAIGVAKNQAVKNIAFSKSKIILEERYQEMINEFNNHPVTEEIEAGPAARSSFLPYGNLFSYIGFYKSKDPIQPIRTALRAKTKILNRARFDKKLFGYVVEVSVPTPTDIWKVTPYPDSWGNISWARDLEASGVSGINAYVYRLRLKPSYGKYFGNSRSGTAIQHPGMWRKMPNKSLTQPRSNYITKILSDFRGKFRVGGRFT